MGTFLQDCVKSVGRHFQPCSSWLPIILLGLWGSIMHLWLPRIISNLLFNIWVMAESSYWLFHSRSLPRSDRVSLTCTLYIHATQFPFQRVVSSLKPYWRISLFFIIPYYTSLIPYAPLRAAALSVIHMTCSLLVIAVLLRVLLAPMKQRANLVTIGIAACVASLVATPSDDTSIAPTATNVPPPALQRPPTSSHSGYPSVLSLR